MKVAFFFGALNRGGAESLVCDICKQKDIAPFDMACLYRKEGELSDAFKSTGVDRMKIELRGNNIIQFLFSFRRIVLANHFDVVHAQTGFNALICLVSLAFTSVKLVTTFHGFSFATAPWWQRKLVYRHSSKIVCVSEYEKEYYERAWGLPSKNKLCVVYNGIDFARLDTPFPDLQNPIQVDRNTLNMIMVGSFRSGRSQSFVCEVAESMNQKGIPFNLFFVGRRDNVEYQRFDQCFNFCTEHNLSDKVHFLGSRSDVPFLLKQMDLFIYASEHDSFGIAVLEAIASSLPVLVNDWAVMKEISGDGRLACLYETGNIEDCTSKVLEFQQRRIDHQEEINRINQNNAKVVREQFSIEKHVNNLLGVYLSCQ